jgi:uncharacterized protein YjiS (DUF1127 family)
MSSRTADLPFSSFASAYAGLPLASFLSLYRRGGALAPTVARLSPMALLALYRQRRRLAALDEARLADIGVSRDEALTEAARPLWDVPASWRA